MIDNNNVKVIVYDNSLKFINYLIYNKIKYESLEKCNDYFLLILDYEDYKRIKKYLLSYKIEIDSLSGIGKVEETIKKYIVDIKLK